MPTYRHFISGWKDNKNAKNNNIVEYFPKVLDANKNLPFGTVEVWKLNLCGLEIWNPSHLKKISSLI